MGREKVYQGGHEASEDSNEGEGAADRLEACRNGAYRSRRPVQLLLPVVDDRGNETLTLRNLGTTASALNGWLLRDRADNEFHLTGTIAAGGDLEISLTFDMPLNNTGDEVELVNPQGAVVHRVMYTAAKVAPGVAITFP